MTRRVMLGLHVPQVGDEIGTLYTVQYNPTDLTAEFLWPDRRVQQSFAAFSAQ